LTWKTTTLLMCLHSRPVAAIEMKKNNKSS
jgi:hypothetical protein